MEVEISAVGGVSPDSPLGAALLGAKVGDVVDVEAPSGSWKASVLAITPDAVATVELQARAERVRGPRAIEADVVPHTEVVREAVLELRSLART